jgi:hypothetical protein
MSKKAKAHQLYKQIPGLNVVWAIAGGNLTAQIQSSGWTYHPQTANGQTYQAFANRSYIDLTGWTAQDLTTFTTGIDIQKDKVPLVSLPSGVTSPLVWVYDFLTTDKITDTELSAVSGTTPGFLPSTVDLMQVIYGEQQSLAVNSNIPGTYITVAADTFGSGNPTASDKLHWTRVIITTLAGDDDKTGSVSVQPTNLIVQAATMEEKDLVYMERLRRSYVTQGEL